MSYPEEYEWYSHTTLPVPRKRVPPTRAQREPEAQTKPQARHPRPTPPPMPPLMPKMEPLESMPNPLLKKKRTSAARPTVARPAGGRTRPLVSSATRRAIVAEQPRDQHGRFASTGRAIMTGVRNLFRPAPLVPTSLSKKRPQAPAAAQKAKKPPVLERGVVGRARAVANGDYGRFQKRNARKNATAQFGELGKKPVRRKRRKLIPTGQPARPRKAKRGWLRRFLFG